MNLKASLQQFFYSVLRLLRKPTSPAPMLPSSIAPGAGIVVHVIEAIALRELHQEQSKPILEEIGSRLDDWFIEVLPKSLIGLAVGYARGQWIALNRYIDYGDLDIDNNLAERVLRTVAIGRKNWLFAGSDAGAERAAIIYSLIASCMLCEIDPFAYLRNVLDRISTHPASRITELPPSGWNKCLEVRKWRNLTRLLFIYKQRYLDISLYFSLTKTISV